MICLEKGLLLFIVIASVLYNIHAFQIQHTSIDPNNPVQVGSTVRLSCQTDGHYEYCTWKHKTRACNFEWKYSSGTVHKTECKELKDRTIFNGNYNNYECAMELNDIQLFDNGDWSCEMEKYVLGSLRGSTHKKVLSLNVIPKVSDLVFEIVGDGWCRPFGCDIQMDTCRVNGYYKDGSNHQYCRASCLNELNCIGFAISEKTFDVAPNRCYLYGNISPNKKDGGWIAYRKKYFHAYTSSENVGVSCYRIQDLQYTWKENTYCSNELTIDEYATLLEAQAACSLNHDCNMISDISCDGVNFYTCSGTPNDSSNGSCSWIKKRETCQEVVHNGVVLWDEWTPWSQCRNTVHGPQRRRFSDPLVRIPLHFDISCLLDAVEDSAIEIQLQDKIIVENEFDPSMPRVANVKNCTVEDELPEMCERIPIEELPEFCSISEFEKYLVTDYVNEPRLKCRKTCRKTIINGETKNSGANYIKLWIGDATKCDLSDDSFGTFSTVQKCANECATKPGCKKFVYDTNNSSCYWEKASSGYCPDYWEDDLYQTYGLYELVNLVNDTICFNHQYQCDDGFCLEGDAIGNQKPDCIYATTEPTEHSTDCTDANKQYVDDSCKDYFFMGNDDSFVAKTSSACSVTENKYDIMSGLQKLSGMNKSICEAQCFKYDWCRGILVENSNGLCRLLTEVQPDPIDGWSAQDFGNWAEPDQWKNSPYTYYTCYEKVFVVHGDWAGLAFTYRIEKTPFGNCNQCDGAAGEKYRTAKILSNCTNADQCNIAPTSERISCNKINAKDECETDGYLEFGDYIPWAVIYYFDDPGDVFGGLTPRWGGEGEMLDELRERLLNRIETWTTRSKAQFACLNDKNCCGVTFSKALNYTLRNGAIVNRYDTNEAEFDPNTDLNILFPIKDFTEDGVVSLQEIWGTKSWRKDCFNENRQGTLVASNYCSDKLKYCSSLKKYVPDFETKYCTKKEYVLNCTKSCGFC